MPAPTPLRCLKSGCDFVTPQCPTWDPMMELLRMHVNLEHPSETPPAPAAGAGASAKMEKIRRPTLNEESTETDWNFFVSKWTRYKRSAKLRGEDLVDQLWACMSEGLERQCHDHGASVDTTTEEQLLELMKAMSIRGVNKLCNVVEFLNLKQKENETIQKFISRVRGQALTCDFKIKSKCSKVGCSQQTECSYADKLSAHIIVRGLYDPDIQEDVLKLAATTEDELDLKKVTEVVLAQETGNRSRKLLNDEDMGLHNLSQHKKQKQNRQADARVLNESCAHCGEFGHGYSASVEVRKALCPAFGKQCEKCNFNNHYTSLCKKQRGGKANALDLEDRSSKASSGSESENEIGAFGFFNTLKTKGEASSSPPPSSVESDHYDADSDRSSVSPNTERDEFGWFYMSTKSPLAKISNKTTDPLPHYEMNESGKWKVKPAKPHPKITVNVEICQDGYNQIGAAVPQSSHPHSVTCSSLPDTGSQIVVAGPDLLKKLNVSKHELFKVSTNVKMVDCKRLQLIGGLMITISAMGSDGKQRISKHMCYIGEKIETLFLSKDACVNLGIIPKTFPSIEYEATTLQHVLHQPSSQQMMGTPRTQWKEIDTVADTLKKLSLMNPPDPAPWGES